MTRCKCRKSLPISSRNKIYCNHCLITRRKETSKRCYEKRSAKNQVSNKYEKLRYLLSTRKNQGVSIYEIYGYIGKVDSSVLRQYMHLMRKNEGLVVIRKRGKDWIDVK